MVNPFRLFCSSFASLLLLPPNLYSERKKESGMNGERRAKTKDARQRRRKERKRMTSSDHVEYPEEMGLKVKGIHSEGEREKE